MHTRLYDLYHGILYIKHQTGTSLRRFGTRATGCRIKIIPVTILVQACGGARKTRVLESFLTVPLRSQSTVHSRRALVIQALRIPASGRLCPRSSIVEHGNHGLDFGSVPVVEGHVERIRVVKHRAHIRDR
jgi:hypothetical protein